MPSFVLTGTSIPNPSPTDPTNSGTVPHDQEHTLVNNEVAAIGGYFNVAAGQANKPQITSAAASSPVVLGAAGSDTNISISITPKGTGGVADLGGLTLSATSIITDATTGLKIGTAAGQKLGFYNATPVVQPSGNALSALSALGLVSAPTLGQADISGLTAGDSPSFAGISLGSGSLSLTGSVASSGARATKVWATDLDVSNPITGSVSGSAANVTGTVAIANGGTGQTSAQAALDALTQVSGATAGYVLTKNASTGHADWEAGGGGSMVYPSGSGVAIVSGGASWGTTLDTNKVGGMTQVSESSLSSASSVTVTGLSAGKRYKIILDLVQNSSSGTVYLQCNSDTGSNYLYSIMYTTSGTNAYASTATGSNIFLGTPGSGGFLMGEYTLQTAVGDDTKVLLIGATNSGVGVAVSQDLITNTGYYTGSSSLSSITIATTAGTLSGTVDIYQMN